MAFLSTRVTKCTDHDVEKLVRLVKYVRYSKEMGVTLRPGSMGLTVRLFADADTECTAMGNRIRNHAW